MNHPTHEEWMAYLYKETPPPARASLKAHLESCPVCQRNYSNWKAATGALARWKLVNSSPDERNRPAAPALKWALAALLVLGLGYGIGRQSVPAPDAAAIRAAVEPALRASLAAEVKRQVQAEFNADWQAVLSNAPDAINTDFRHDLHSQLMRWTTTATAGARAEQERLFTEFIDSYRADRQQDREAILTLFDQTERKRALEYMSLRRAVETVALVADDKFQRTALELGQLASYTQANFIPDDSN